MNGVIDNFSTEQLDDYIEQNKSRVVLIDVRNRSSYMIKHIKGAINIAYEDIEKGNYRIEKDKIIVVYCDRGGISMLAAKAFVKRGYMVKNVVGGIRNYRGKNIIE